MRLVNGIASDVISTRDRGLNYGDGLFETMAVRSGAPVCWSRHMARLAAGCQRLRIPCPPDALLWEEAGRVCSGVALGVLKIVVTRGTNGRGYRMPDTVTPTRVLSSHPWPEMPASWGIEGVSVTICQTRLGINPQLAGIKHLNRLEQVMGRSEWDGPRFAEGLMLDTAGRVIEGTTSNLFLVTADGLVTPDLAHAGVAGIMRDLVLEEADTLDVAARVASVSREDLSYAEELFLSNSLFGIWPIRSLDGRVYRVGPLALRLRDRLLAKGCIAGQDVK